MVEVVWMGHEDEKPDKQNARELEEQIPKDYWKYMLYVGCETPPESLWAEDSTEPHPDNWAEDGEEVNSG